MCRRGYSAADERRSGDRCRRRPGAGRPVPGAARLRRSMPQSSVVPALFSALARDDAAPAWVPAPVAGSEAGRPPRPRRARLGAAPGLRQGGPDAGLGARVARSPRWPPPPPPPPSPRSRRARRPRSTAFSDTGSGSTSTATRRPGPGEVMNVLRWRSGRGDMRRLLPPRSSRRWRRSAVGPCPPSRAAEFASTGFTAAHLTGARLFGWSVPSALVVNVRRLLATGETFVYAYYDGLDKVAHEHGLGDHYLQELAAVDRLVADLLGGPAPRGGAGGDVGPRPGRSGQRHPPALAGPVRHGRAVLG